MKRISVLNLTNSFPTPKHRYRGIFTLNQIVTLSDVCDNTVLFPRPWLPFLKSERLERKAHFMAHSYKKREMNGFELLRPKFLYLPRMILLRSLQFRRLLFKELGSNRYDILHAHWAHPSGYAASELTRKVGIPCVVTIHAGDIYRDFHKRTRRWMIKKTLKNATVIISVAKYFKHFFDLLEIPEDKIRYIPNGVDTSLFHPLDREQCRQRLDLPLDKAVYLYIGNLYADKGPYLLLRAFLEFAQRESHVCLVLAGTGPLRKDIEHFVRKNGLSDVVFLFDAQPHEMVPIFLNAANFFVLASKSEGNPVTVLESLCCGTPVLGTDIPAISDLLISEEFGILFARDVLGVAKAMCDANSRNWDRNKIVEYGRDHFGWDRIAKRINGVYSELLKTTKVPS